MQVRVSLVTVGDRVNISPTEMYPISDEMLDWFGSTYRSAEADFVSVDEHQYHCARELGE